MSVQLPEAFWKTTYLAETPVGVLRLRVGLTDPGLEALLRDTHITHWAYITAWNPDGVVLDRPLNDQRQHALRNDLQGRTTYEGWGVGDIGEHMEQSLLVLDITPDQAKALGRKYGQLAILTGTRGSTVELVECTK